MLRNFSKNCQKLDSLSAQNFEKNRHILLTKKTDKEILILLLCVGDDSSKFLEIVLFSLKE